MINKKFWKDKKVLITGHTGFKGSWLTLMLNKLGAQVFGISNSKFNIENHKLFRLNKKIKEYKIDINNFKKLNSSIHI